MANWKLTVEYDGTRYYGWQEQKSSRTVAGELRTAAESFFERPVEIAGAGRTDAGVHALGQVARLRTDGRPKRGNLLHELNDRLPPDINVLKVEEAQPGFNPRKDALQRYYVYQISRRRSAFAKRFVWWVKDNLDRDAMSEASQALLGRHDFSRFCDKRAEESSTVVVVSDVHLRSSGDLLLFRIGASHFLWKMVRRVVGALVEVGRGSISVEEFSSMIEPNNRQPESDRAEIAAYTAPPSGLFLERVVFSENQRPDDLVPVFPVSRL